MRYCKLMEFYGNVPKILSAIHVCVMQTSKTYSDLLKSVSEWLKNYIYNEKYILLT